MYRGVVPRDLERVDFDLDDLPLRVRPPDLVDLRAAAFEDVGVFEFQAGHFLLRDLDQVGGNLVEMLLVFGLVLKRPADGFSAGASRQREIGWVVHRGVQETDVSVHEQEVHAADMPAVELIRFRARVARAVLLSAVPEDHA